MGCLIGDLTLGGLPFTDLPHDAHRSQDGAIVIGQHRDRGFDQQVTTIEGSLDQLSAPAPLSGDDTGDLPQVGVPACVEHVEQLQQPAADRIFSCDPVQLLRRRISECDAPVCIGGDDRIGHVGEDLPEVALFLAVGQTT